MASKRHFALQFLYISHSKFQPDFRNSLDGIFDFAFRIAQFRKITNNKIPQKLIRQWREMFHSGLDLFDEKNQAALDLLNLVGKINRVFLIGPPYNLAIRPIIIVSPMLRAIY